MIFTVNESYQSLNDVKNILTLIFNIVHFTYVAFKIKYLEFKSVLE